MPIDWLPPVAPTKASLIAGIRATIQEHTGLQNLDTSFLDRIAEDNLFILAYVMGFRDDESERRMRRSDEILRLAKAEREASFLRSVERWEHERTVVRSLSAEMTNAALNALAEGLLTSSDAEITAKAQARGIDPESLMVRIQKMAEARNKISD